MILYFWYILFLQNCTGKEKIAFNIFIIAYNVIMFSSKINLLIGIVSIICVFIISTILILEIYNIREIKKASFNNFLFLKNNLIINQPSKEITKLNHYYKTMDNIKAFQIKTANDLPIYLYSKLGLDPSYVNSEFLAKNKSYFDIIYSDTITLEKIEYKLNAIFSILSKKEISSFFIKTSLVLFIYILTIAIFLVNVYYLDNKLQAQNASNSYNPNIQKISDELKKSASFDQDIVLVLTASTGNQINQNTIEFEKILKSQFPFHDLIFKLDNNTFGILIPNTDLESGIKLVENFDQTFVSKGALKFPIMFGLSSRNGRLISGNIIINEARAALKKAMRNRNYPIIGFRPNPARYREYLSKTKNSS